MPNTPNMPTLDCDLSIDELGEAFEELSHNYDFLKTKYLKMKKENESLNHKIFILTKEKDGLFSTLTPLKRILMLIKFLAKINFH